MFDLSKTTSVNSTNIVVHLCKGPSGCLDAHLTIPNNLEDRDETEYSCNQSISHIRQFCKENNLSLRLHANDSQFRFDDVTRGLCLRGQKNPLESFHSTNEPLLSSLKNGRFDQQIAIGSDPQVVQKVSDADVLTLERALKNLYAATEEGTRFSSLTNLIFESTGSTLSLKDIVMTDQNRAEIIYPGLGRGDLSDELFDSLHKSLMEQMTLTAKAGLNQFTLDVSKVEKGGKEFLGILLSLQKHSANEGISLLLKGATPSSGIGELINSYKLDRVFSTAA